MNFADSPPTLALDELYIGAYVMLDGGWLSHPFPVNNFKITTAQQLATLRGLKFTRVRWAPERSDARPDAGSAPAMGPSAPGTDAQHLAQPLAQQQAQRQAQAEAHRLALAQDRESLRRCEKRFAEATDGCKRIAQLAPAHPVRAGELSLEITRALLGDLMSAQEVSVRLLTETSGDKSSMHAINVAVVSLMMGRSLGMTESDLHDLGQGAMLHDLGKLELPDRVRHREDGFSAAELAFYQEHVAHGVAHGRRMGISAGALAVVAQHHEHADGSGFPARLSSDRTTLPARIVALIDRYDNLVNPPIPSRAITPHEALSMLFAQGKQGQGTRRFDTAILGAFIKMMGVYPPGSVVQLTDDRFALVVAMNSSRPLKPRVLVHDSSVRSSEALVLDLETQPQLGVRRSLKPSHLPRDALDFLSPRPRVAYFFEPMASGPGALDNA